MIGFVGAGLLGSGFVERLLARGEAVRVWNRTPGKTAALAARGAEVAADLSELRAPEITRIHLVLTADDAVDATLAALGPVDVPVLDHSTNLPERVAERYARLRGVGVRYTHAPVFMAPSNAREGTGLMLVAGTDAALLEPTLTPMTGRVWNVGPRPDLAAVYKLLGNATMLSMTGLLGDLLKMGAGQGLDAPAVLALYEHFRPQGWTPAMAPRILASKDGPASFELTMAQKDVRLSITTAAGAELAVLPGVDAAMQAAIEEGLGDRDYAIFALDRRRS
jgi:3-hydroxyisobutyrate dehydrogenase